MTEGTDCTPTGSAESGNAARAAIRAIENRKAAVSTAEAQTRWVIQIADSEARWNLIDPKLFILLTRKDAGSRLITKLSNERSSVVKIAISWRLISLITLILLYSGISCTML
jgi:hypothetical protein